jgi:hypothetical protein
MLRYIIHENQHRTGARDLDYQFIGLLIALGVHAFVMIWWAATLTQRVAQIADRVNTLDGDQRKQELTIQQIDKSVAVIEVQSKTIADGITRLDAGLANIHKRLDTAATVAAQGGKS